MTAQEVFDIVARHLLTQGKKCGESSPPMEGNCYYRGPAGTMLEGLKCAVGCLIMDEEYVPSMEGWGVCRVLPGRLMEHLILCRELQRIHDDQPVKYWRDALRELADSYHDLSAAVLDEVVA